MWLVIGVASHKEGEMLSVVRVEAVDMEGLGSCSVSKGDECCLGFCALIVGKAQTFERFLKYVNRRGNVPWREVAITSVGINCEAGRAIFLNRFTRVLWEESTAGGKCRVIISIEGCRMGYRPSVGPIM